MELKSSAYHEGGSIPSRYTCDGQGISPALSWSDVPPGTGSLALILHDPDAPRTGGFTHWIVYDMPPDSTGLKENILRRGVVLGVGVQGKNDGGRVGYMGPCPPSGRHRYMASLYALDSRLELEPGAYNDEVRAAMDGHILASAVLMGTYATKTRNRSS